MALPTIVADRSALSFVKQRGAYASVVQDHRVHTGNVFFVMTGGTDTAACLPTCARAERFPTPNRICSVESARPVKN